jgi:dimethylargininase
MAPHPRALVREIPDTFDRAIVSDPGATIDVPAARDQYTDYLRRLEKAGYELVVIPPDPNYPDCVFIEDTALVAGEIAVATRPGAPSRRGEVGPVAEALERWYPVVSIEAPATLDGGDVIVLTSRVLAGRSKRTDSEGIAQLASIVSRIGLETLVVPVHQGLHLKSAVLPIDAETMVVTPGAVDESPFDGFRLLYEHETERFQFSALPLADGSVMVTASAPRTTESLQGLGFDVVPIDISQIQAADGGLTCMSLLLDTP